MIKKIRGLFKNSEPPQPTQRQRADRLLVYPLHDIGFELDAGAGPGLRLLISNISETGVGLNTVPELPPYKKGDTLKGFLHFPEARFPVSLRVVHGAASSIGCEFVGECAAIKSTVSHYFALELAARDLLEVNKDILKEEPDGTPRLFRGRRNCELFLVENEGKIVRFQLSFFGNYIEGGDRKPTKYGFLSATETDRLQYKGSSIVRLVKELSPEVIQSAVRFLESVKTLSAEQRNFLSAQIRNERA